MRLGLTLLISLAIISCDDNSVVPPNPGNISAADVLVANEGGFQRGNASLGLYNVLENVYETSIYQNNNNEPLGDVLQSINTLNGQYWLVLNNSGKIVIIDSISLKKVDQINGLVSPRFIQFSSNGKKAFVSDLYGDEITVINTTSRAITNRISLDGWADQMARIGQQIYVANREKPYVYVISEVSETVVDSIMIPNNPNSLIWLRDSLIGVLCEGKLGSSDRTKFQVIHVGQKTLLKEHTFDEGVKPSLLRKSPRNGNIYCAFKGIHYIDPVDFEYQYKTIDLPDANVYGFDIDPSNGNMYVSDAKDYVQKSTVRVYSNSEDFKQEFTAGVICNQLIFR